MARSAREAERSGGQLVHLQEQMLPSERCALLVYSDYVR